MNQKAEWVTLAKSDPLFYKYLSNRLDGKKKAIPVRTSYPLSKDEIVTFKIVDSTPLLSSLPFLFALLRLRDWVYFLAPVTWVIFYVQAQGVFWDPWLALLSLFAVLFLNLAAFFINDSVDFETGIDRISPKKSVALIESQVSLTSLKKASWISLLVGSILGLPAVWVFPEVILWVAGPGLLALWFWWKPKYQFKKKLYAELTVSALYGVGLMGGMSLGITGTFSAGTLLMGLLFSLLFHLILNARNFENLLAEYLISDLNFVHRLGFDHARFFLVFLWFLCGVNYLLWQSFFGSSFWALIGSLHFVFLGLIMALKAKNVISPLGSAKREFCFFIRSSVVSVYFLLLAQVALMRI